VPEGDRAVIADTSPLQYLFQAGLLELLPTLYGVVTIPEAVVRELAEGRARGVSLPDPSACPWIRVAAVRESAVLSLAPNLGPGEREALALAAQTPGSLLLIDDALARRHARLLQFTFSGTLGVLLRAKASGHLVAVAPVLDRLDALRFRLDPLTRTQVLRLADEAP
jgi:predicted nucleic acid-binding protein